MGYTENRASILVVGGVSFGILYVLGIVIYRLWFHPLAKYPGPFLNRVSQVSIMIIWGVKLEVEGDWYLMRFRYQPYMQ